MKIQSRKHSFLLLLLISLVPLLLLAGIITAVSISGGEHDKEVKDTSLKLNEPHNIRGVTSYRRVFNDLNEKHLNIAQSIGIRPIASRREAEQATASLHPIATGDRYAVDSLTHSIPYLVPGAAALLDTIGQNFLDSLAAKGLNPNKIIVTSVLRTQEDVKRLRRRNGNASPNSAHFYGTTFDISWVRFCKVEESEEGRPLQSVRSDTLKMVLAEVLRDLQKADRCYIKHEQKQGCFHITTRQRR